MEIQLAYDAIALQTALSITRDLKDIVDIFELGTPFLYTYSLGAVRAFREAAFDRVLHADLKILDGGGGMAELAYASGADMTSVSARTWLKTIGAAAEVSHTQGKRLLVDFEGTPEEELPALVKRIDPLEPTYLCIHRRFGAKNSVENELRIMREMAIHSKIALAGGINASMVQELAGKALLPDLLIVGKAVTLSQSPRQALMEIIAAGRGVS